MGWFMRMFARSKIYDDLSDEIEQHLAEKTDTLMAEGVSREDAERAAMRGFGNVTRIKERSREPWRWPRAEVLWADLRFAFRKLGKSPGFTATAVSTLALGMGANVVVFSVLYGLVLRPLDVLQPKNLFQVHTGSDQHQERQQHNANESLVPDCSWITLGLGTTREIGATPGDRIRARGE
jgi:hypothetical protein